MSSQNPWVERLTSPLSDAQQIEVICYDLAQDLNKVITLKSSEDYSIDLYTCANDNDYQKLKLITDSLAKKKSSIPITKGINSDSILDGINNPNTATLSIGLRAHSQSNNATQMHPSIDDSLAFYNNIYAKPVAKWLEKKNVSSFYIKTYSTPSAKTEQPNFCLLHISVNKNDSHAMMALKELMQGIKNAKETLLPTQKGRS